MLLNNSKTNVNIIMRECINEKAFSMIVLDWISMSLEDRQKIIESIGYDSGDAYEIAKEYCTAAILIPRINGLLDFSYCKLHISTLGAIIQPKDIIDFVKNKLDFGVDELENIVTLSASEKLEAMSAIIPINDMRGVK